MFENHDQLRQAPTECMCNMVVNKVGAQDARVTKAWKRGLDDSSPPEED